MAGKRKRRAHGTEGGQKRQRVTGALNGKDPVVKQAVLSQYYPQVVSLREYLISKLPASSKIRRKKILSVGRRTQSQSGDAESDRKLSEFLDQTLIGILKDIDVSQDERWRQWTTFSQTADDSVSALANRSGIGVFSQTEIIDFVIWLLFSKNQSANGRVQHLLCQGFRRDVNTRSVIRGEHAASTIPGVVSIYPNSHVTSMKAWPWPRVLALLGKEGEKAMIDLILDCGTFVAVGSGLGTYYQLSGQPLGELQILPQARAKARSVPIASSDLKSPLKSTSRSPSSINFVRNRMLYARPTLNAKHGVRFGLRHIHVLNRYPLTGPENTNDHVDAVSGLPERNTILVMMYIFPRQFGLHNVFTSDVDPRQTVQPFQDYTLRKDEINKNFPPPMSSKIPKRLRGRAASLVQKLQIQHSRCPYKKLLEHYCPLATASSAGKAFGLPSQQSSWSSTGVKTQNSLHTSQNSTSTLSSIITVPPRKPSMMDHATPQAMVSAFCRAVASHLVPNQFWGTGDLQRHNKETFDRNIDRFIGLRRFESLSLHEVSQGLKISGIEWLGPPECSLNKISQTDLNKRWEIFHEFLYYLFDSILIPLIRANFHVTESNIHRYRLFYFRQDVWRSLAEPALASLKLTMFEEVKLEHARKLLNSRALGFSQVRLLPKEIGARPIMNLRRRSIKKGSKDMLGISINSVLAPVYSALTLEKTLNPSRLGSTLFSVGDLYTKLKTFKSELRNTSLPFYFAKVDVKSAFDTIPQSAVVDLMSSLPSEEEYQFSKHMEIKPGENYREYIGGSGRSTPIRKWTAIARAPDDFQNFDEILESDLAVGRKNTIFVGNVVNQFRETDELLNLLEEHIRHNMVKIGKKFYRQKEGIPQGSVLSSLLCNYFYADLEAKHLGFLQTGDSLLLRLIDDFLLVTTDRLHAKRFLQVMHDGLSEFGVQVNPDKSLVNFEATINGKKVARLVGSRSFPYCGSFIDTWSLDITRDRERRKDMATVDSLTVEFSKTPGKTFHRKVLNSFKIQAHAMFLDTSFSSLHTVLSNVYNAFTETATKLWTYARCLPVGKQPGTKLMIKTINDLIELAFVLMKSKGRNKKNAGYKCGLSKLQVEWLAINAFLNVLRKRQSKYLKAIKWLNIRIATLKARKARMCERMRNIVSENG